MPFADRFHHFQHMVDLIRRKATGNVEEFAQKLDVSKATLYRDIEEIKSLGLDVHYDAEQRRFELTSEGKKLFL